MTARGRWPAGRPSAEQVRRARRSQWLALAIYGIPLLLLMGGLYLRMFASAERLLDLGMFGYVFPLIVVTVLASLLWALVVEPYSRGNALGDHLHSQLAVDAETVELDEQYLSAGRDAAQEGRRQVADCSGRAALGGSGVHRDGRDRSPRPADRPRRAGCADSRRGAPGEPDPPTVPAPGPGRPGRRGGAGAHGGCHRALEQSALAPIEAADSPHSVYSAPPAVVPDLAFVAPETLAPYADSTLGFDADDEDAESPRWRRRALLASAVVAALVVAATAWYSLSRPDQVAAAPAPAADR